MITTPSNLVPMKAPGRAVVLGASLARWPGHWGCDRPAEERVEIGICCASAYFTRTGACALGPGMDPGRLSSGSPSRSSAACAIQPQPCGAPFGDRVGASRTSAIGRHAIGLLTPGARAIVSLASD